MQRDQINDYKSAYNVTTRMIYASLGSVSFGYSWAVYNQLFDTVKPLYNWSDEYSDWIQGAINSLFIFTAILGCFMFAVVKNFKRTTAFKIVDIGAIVGAICLLSTNNYVFWVGRTIQGFVAGCNTVIVPIYLKEYVPSALYSKMSMLLTMGIVFGQVMSFVIGAPIKYVKMDYYWRICLIPCIGVPLVRLIYIFTVKYDTPTYYLANSDKETAMKAIQQVYTVSSAERILQEEIRSQTLCSDGKLEEGTVDLLKNAHHRKIAIVGVWIFFFQQFAGINAVNFYSTEVFKKLGSDRIANILTGVWGLLDISSLFISLLFIVDNFSRKTLILAGSIICGIPLIACGALSFTDFPLLATIAIFTYIVMFNFTLSPITWTVVSEMTHSNLMFIPTSSHWIFAFIIAQFFPKVITLEWLQLGGTFFCLGAITLMNFVVGYLIVRETKGLKKEEVYRLYSNSPNEENNNLPFGILPGGETIKDI